jgi:hypothetical protein
MPLISTEVEVRLVGWVVRYYRDLGYKLPLHMDKQGRVAVPKTARMMVRVEDLPPQSAVKVDVLCPDCNKTRSIHWQDYKKSSDRCLSCSSKINGANTKNVRRPDMEGENNINWHGGTSSLYDVLRRKTRLRDWRIAVYTRDGFKCRKCGDDRGGNLNVHHIVNTKTLINGYGLTKENYCDFLSVLYDIENGLTLCTTCHKLLHKKLGQSFNSKQIEDFLNESE